MPRFRIRWRYDPLIATSELKPSAVTPLTLVTGPTSAVTAYKADVEVTVVDISKARIESWQSDKLPIYEPGLEDIVRAARDGITAASSKEAIPHDTNWLHSRVTDGHRPIFKKKLFFSTDIENAITEADLIFVCVNTPTKATGVGKGAAANLGFIENATRMIAKVATTDKIVVEKSTVPCRTAESIRAIVSLNKINVARGES